MYHSHILFALSLHVIAVQRNMYPLYIPVFFTNTNNSPFLWHIFPDNTEYSISVISRHLKKSCIRVARLFQGLRGIKPDALRTRKVHGMLLRKRLLIKNSTLIAIIKVNLYSWWQSACTEEENCFINLTEGMIIFF